ncbi:ribonuclease BN (tRNA processing enzyme) [Sediminihabitans luteus]|uniref:Ribonuclease BN (tRNA processing enzyme) n=1 Tax=Sediminihabitans luteus TaxID=1138585 RepID=A0A2M9CYC4_9CELL|nr:MBL fold metallo-hydrolase [Sediminihabitans luteus]PJJ76900.1 ribonuclease BN (tRNA processing enzyme) [Sediminihabitans luteus]GII99541.1 metal-dependent hydrolase [Sediminihabitans luteus]
MRLTTVGTSGSFAGPDSPASCHLVQVGADVSPDGRAWNVVLDLGNGALGALQRHVDPLALDAVLLSHLHPDHFVDVCGLYVYLRYHPGAGAERGTHRAPLPVLGPDDVAARVAQAYGLGPDEDMSAQLDLRPYAGTFDVGPLRVEPVPMYHPVPAFGLRVTGPSTVRPGERATLAYTGDTDYCENVVGLARDVDLLLCEAAFHEGRDDLVEPGIHLTGRRAGRVAREAGARRLVLTHVPPWNDRAATAAEAAGEYAGPLEVATSGATYTV